MWTTHKELAWLCERIPEYRKVQSTHGQQIQTWLRKLTPEFVEAFPNRGGDSRDAVFAVYSLSFFNAINAHRWLLFLSV